LVVGVGLCVFVCVCVCVYLRESDRARVCARLYVCVFFWRVCARVHTCVEGLYLYVREKLCVCVCVCVLSDVRVLCAVRLCFCWVCEDDVYLCKHVFMGVCIYICCI